MTDLAPGMRMAEWLEQAWMERYLARQMSQAETDWFEAYMLDKVNLLEQVESDTELSSAFCGSFSEEAQPRAERQPHATAGPRPRNVSEASRHRASSMRFGRYRTFATAATLVLMLGAGWFGHRILTGGGESAELLASPQRILFDVSRGPNGSAYRASGNDKSPYLVLDVVVPADTTRAFLHVTGQPDRTLIPDSEGIVTVIVRREVFDSLHMTLEVERREGERYTNPLSTKRSAP